MKTTRPAANFSGPTPQLETKAGVVPFRRFHCRGYDRCLDLADRSGWPGFTCQSCDAFVPLTAEEEMRDALGISRLLHEVHHIAVVA